MPLVPQGVVSSLGNAMVLPSVISTLSVGKRESSPRELEDFYKLRRHPESRRPGPSPRLRSWQEPRQFPVSADQQALIDAISRL